MTFWTVLEAFVANWNRFYVFWNILYLPTCYTFAEFK